METNKTKKLQSIDIDNPLLNQKVNRSTAIYYFIIQCARPPCFYFIYIYCADILTQKCGLTAGEAIAQNFFVSIVDLLGILGLTYLSYIMNPIKILKFRLYLFMILLSMFPAVINQYPNASYVFIFQCLASLFVFDHGPCITNFLSVFSHIKTFHLYQFFKRPSKNVNLLSYLFWFSLCNKIFWFLWFVFNICSSSNRLFLRRILF